MTGPRMWPKILPAQVRSDRYRGAEVKIYDLLAKSLSSSWSVFYSRPWLGLTATGGERDGECDFIVAHPRHGFLALEVKGGGISYDPTTDAWVSRDRDEVRHSIKNPVDQARTAKHQLLRKLIEQKNWNKEKYVRTRHGVVFPDAPSPPSTLGPDKPREIFCCRPDLPAIATWIEQRLTGGNEDGLGSDGLQALEKLLASPFELRVPLGHLLADDDAAIAYLTPQQFHILDAISALPRVAIGGGAGTGKTIVALEDASRLASGGAKVLLTCLSQPLARDLAERLRATTVEVFSFEGLCESMCARSGIEFNHRVVFSEDLGPEVLMRAVLKAPGLRYDAVIVDEAQDFPSHWWIALEALLNSTRNSRLHAFFDTNQTVYGNTFGELANFQMIPIHLSRNLRNTRAIHQASSKFYGGLPITPDGPDGVKVVWIETLAGTIHNKVSEEVKRLISKDAVAAKDIVVLATTNAAAQELKGHLAGPVKLGVSVETVHDFKGLERPVVLLAATTDLSDEPELAYVALSRARTLLTAIGPAAVLAWVKAPDTID